MYEQWQELESEVDIEEFSELHSELLYYLEEKIIYGESTDDEIILYNDYINLGILDVDSEICKKLIQEMSDIYKHGF